MITKPTVLIVGAGASRAYGYPLGQELVDKLTARFNTLPEQQRQFLDTAGFSESKNDEFAEALRLSLQNSIDAFLEHQPGFRKIGKFRLAHTLVNCENPAWFTDPQDAEDHWYRYLFNKLDAPFERFAENKLSVITFNYDRSLEQALYVSLLNRYPVNNAEVADAIRQIPIVHVHGTLGAHDWQEPDGRAYGSVEGAEDLVKASESIKIISEAADDTPELKAARELISTAATVYFLGFGYDSGHDSSYEKPGNFQIEFNPVHRVVDNLPARGHVWTVEVAGFFV